MSKRFMEFLGDRRKTLQEVLDSELARLSGPNFLLDRWAKGMIENFASAKGKLYAVYRLKTGGTITEDSFEMLTIFAEHQLSNLETFISLDSAIQDRTRSCSELASRTQAEIHLIVYKEFLSEVDFLKGRWEVLRSQESVEANLQTIHTPPPGWTE